jgi:hypothetical protein
MWTKKTKNATKKLVSERAGSSGAVRTPVVTVGCAHPLFTTIRCARAREEGHCHRRRPHPQWHRAFSLSLPSSPALGSLEEKGLRGGRLARQLGLWEGGIMVLAAAETAKPGWGGAPWPELRTTCRGSRRKRPLWAH